MVEDWKSKIAIRTQRVEELLIDVNWTIESEAKLRDCDSECQKEKVIEWLEEAKEIIEDVLKFLKEE